VKVWRVEAEDGTGPYSSGVNDAKRRRESQLGTKMYRFVADNYYGEYTVNPGFEDLVVREELANFLCDEHSWGDTADTHPGPYAEGWREHEYHCKVFGFYSIDQARAWFAGFGQRLTDAGYHLSEYDVDPDEIKYGKFQIAFTQPKTKPVRHPVIKEIV
jgi:hypothetical protein